MLIFNNWRIDSNNVIAIVGYIIFQFNKKQKIIYIYIYTHTHTHQTKNKTGSVCRNKLVGSVSQCELLWISKSETKKEKGNCKIKEPLVMRIGNGPLKVYLLQSLFSSFLSFFFLPHLSVFSLSLSRDEETE